MDLREIVVCSAEELIYSWQTLEDVPERYDEFRNHVNAWLGRTGFVLGEGTTKAGLIKPYIGEAVQRMEYTLLAPLISGIGPFPLIEHIGDGLVTYRRAGPN